MDSNQSSATDLHEVIAREAGEDVVAEAAVIEDTVRDEDGDEVVVAVAEKWGCAAVDHEPRRHRRGFDPVSVLVDPIVASLEIHF